MIWHHDYCALMYVAVLKLPCIVQDSALQPRFKVQTERRGHARRAHVEGLAKPYSMPTMVSPLHIKRLAPTVFDVKYAV